MEVSLSDDGATWRSVGSFANPETALQATLAASKDNEVRFAPVHSRYIKIHARSLGACPVWHGGAGNPCWLFVDEIVVE